MIPRRAAPRRAALTPRVLLIDERDGRLSLAMPMTGTDFKGMRALAAAAQGVRRRRITRRSPRRS